MVILHFDFETVKVFVTLFYTAYFDFYLHSEQKNQREYHAVYCMRNHGCTLMRRIYFRLVACVLINSTERSTNREGTGQMIVHTVF